MISIVIPTLNEEKFLPRLLESIKIQDFFDYEIIVSDGGSSDKTKEIAESMGCFFIEDKKHRHPSWQRNNGAKISKGDILLFLDADSVLQPGFLKKTLAEFEARKLTGAGFYFVFNPNSFSYHIFSVLSNFFCFFRQYFSPVSVGAGILARRDAHDKIKGFDTEIFLAEDYDYCDRLSKEGKFRMIKSQTLLYSSRRLKKDGWWSTAYAWTQMAMFTFFRKKIKKNKIKYEFGRY
jgi:glycosyltransferase involved in cell wall biosynthesis